MEGEDGFGEVGISVWRIRSCVAGGTVGRSNQIQLDFGLLPTLEAGAMFVALDPELDERLKSFPATHDRAMGALAFSARISNTRASEDGSDIKLREAFCRASFGEFVSMEESIVYDCPNGQHPKIADTRNPLLHVLKQLRNMQFHVMNSTLENEEHGVVWAEQESRMKFWYIQDISVTDFNRLRAAHRYSHGDKEEMVSWFNTSQRKWGVTQLILEAVGAYANIIVNS
jgi:hypothetical protein